MRLDKVYIDGFKNLRQLEVDFDEGKLTTVLIGQNGAGKSNLIEAITQIFRWVDFVHTTPKVGGLSQFKPNFKFRITYRIGGVTVNASNETETLTVLVDGVKVAKSVFEARKRDWFPDLVFGYYSGGSRRLETLFDAHQRRYYDAIKRQDVVAKVAEAQEKRRLFYCRPIHGVLALMALFAFPAPKVKQELASKLGITGFHSLLALFREPSWYDKSQKLQPEELWGAAGPAGSAARRLKGLAFHPFPLQGDAIDDYRDKRQVEAQYATFLPTLDHLTQLAELFADEREMFYALEAVDISDLIREVQVWVTRNNDATGDVGFADLSDGERQLLMVLGLIRVSRGKRALFLLDEPDTHLNPHWQHSYLKLIEDWTGIAAEADNCHIILTSHNPLTISALSRDEVRVIAQTDDGCVTATAPYADPRGMGFTATLTEIFGLASSLDIETQRLVDERNELVQLADSTDEQQRRLIALNDQLARLGFLNEDREPLYQDFLRTWHDLRYADRPPLSPADVEVRQRAMKALIQKLTTSEAKP
ncbi:AAA family ATPase [Hydrogenophaga sp. A37]|uniref:AAA family ATPase n=1 Tax=Hydrogenophaga sp. A37 TaxID=1945864 RepID=UPI000985BE69|nr:AAA family ATPase [Hydrogenophaga sp. A37]OOG85138.1 AAA family ATPase [Hydrogenophaga sp. A37]